jgi:hypothetical protein
MATASAPAPGAALPRLLQPIVWRLRAGVLVEGAAGLAVLLFAGAGVQLGLDYLRRLSLSMRALLLVLLVGAACWWVWRRLVQPLRVPIGAAEVARLFERQEPGLASLLISAVHFAEEDPSAKPAERSPALEQAVMAEAASAWPRVADRVVINRARVRGHALALLVVLAAATTVVAMAPQTVATWFRRGVLLQDVEWAQRTQIFVEGLENGVLTGARGDDLEVRAVVEGVVPRTVEMIYETASGRRGRENMTSMAEGRLRYTFRHLEEELTFVIEGGDECTERVAVQLADRPRVVTSRIEIEPPAYAQLPKVELARGRTLVEALAGSQVRVEAILNKPAAAVEWIGSEAKVSRSASDPLVLTAEFPLAESHSCWFSLTDELGLSNRNPVRFSLRVLPDETPRLTLQLEGAGEMVTPEALLPLAVDAQDDFGLAGLAVEYVVFRGEASETGHIAWPTFAPGTPHFQAAQRWPVAAAAVQPGDRLQFRGSARDFDDVSGPKVGRAPEVTVRVVTRDELLAELTRLEQEYRSEFERLVETQMDVRRDLLSALDDYARTSDEAALTSDLTPLERRQRTVAGSINALRQRFERLAIERRINSLDAFEEMERLEGGIIEPLAELGRREMVAAADSLRAALREPGSASLAELDQQQAGILAGMQRILDRMQQWEGYHEIVSLLRTIQEMQKDLHEETRARVLEQADDVFED